MGFVGSRSTALMNSVIAKTLIKNGLITKEEFLEEIKAMIVSEEDKEDEAEILESVESRL